MLQLPQPPRTSFVLFWSLHTGFTGAVNFSLLDLLLILHNTPSHVLIRVVV
jgi:hypothetical protein